MAANHFCLKWTKFQTNILHAFESLQTTEDLADVTLACEGFSIKAHRFILSACSPYFRSLFKNNPCSHPIVILKDVKYIDLIAIVNFMYHGEVMVSEEQFPSFLQTAMILQVSGLINNETPCSVNKHTEMKKTKVCHSDSIERSTDSLPKKIRSTPVRSNKQTCELGPELRSEIKSEVNLRKFQPVTPQESALEKVKIEKIEQHEERSENQNKLNTNEQKQEGSILEAALEVSKQGSILERSLTSVPSKPSFSCEKPSPLQMLQDISMAKTIFGVQRTDDSEKSNLRSSSESSSSPSTYERASEFLHPLVKIEDTSCDMEVEKEAILSEESAMDSTRSIEVPHHSSQCGNCPHCGKIYSNQSALKYHVRLVHSDLTNMYCCHLCPESFDYREGYKNHMAVAHSIRN